MTCPNRPYYDVVIIGAGLAGLSLARQLLLDSDKTILLIEKRAQIPPVRQKVGESTVQMSAFYFAKVLDLEEHLFREHFMKYNLRFYWKTAGRDNRSLEDYSQAYIRTFSNIPGYQLDRNKLEGELLRLNCLNPRFTFCAPATDLEIDLKKDEAHAFRFNHEASGRSSEQISGTAEWIVDTSGRGKFLARSLGLLKKNPIRHGASFLWVEGLVDVEKLTGLSRRELLTKRERASLGHSPFWLATNHFMGEGLWFWVIPLQGKTSLGLVYDNRLIPHEQIWTAEKLIEWACREFPLFARDLPQRKVLCHGTIRDFSYDCAQTISADRWALAGEAGRFTDPLYSPGGDLIALYNTLIVDAITGPASELTGKVRLYEQLMQSFYQANVPSYATSYNALGDQETMVLKYVWELSVYFSFYVFPFINYLFTDRLFIARFLGKFSRLGRVNKALQEFLSAYFEWKKANVTPPPEPVFYDFSEIQPLKVAESAFYETGTTADEAIEILDRHLENLKELGRFIVAHVYSVVLGNASALNNRAFVENIQLESVTFDPQLMSELYSVHAGCNQNYPWALDPQTLNRLRGERRSSPFSPIATVAKDGMLVSTSEES